MQIELVGRVIKVKKVNGVAYTQLTDKEQGGLIDIQIPGGEDIQNDDLLSIVGTIEAGKGKFGPYLKLVEFESFEKVK